MDNVVEALSVKDVNADRPDDTIADVDTADIGGLVSYVWLDLNAVDDGAEVLAFVCVDGDDFIEVDRILVEMFKDCDTVWYSTTLVVALLVDLYKPGELNPGCGGDTNPELTFRFIKASPDFWTGNPIINNNIKQTKFCSSETFAIDMT